MKSIIPLLICLALPAIATAETQFDREIAQLRAERDKAMAAASEPINRRYQAALEQTLRRAMQASDVDAAVKIKAALSELGVAAHVEPPPSPLQLLLHGSRWEWFNAPEPKGPAANWVEFYTDGTGRSGWNQPLKYEVTGTNHAPCLAGRIRQYVVFRGGHRQEDCPIRPGCRCRTRTAKHEAGEAHLSNQSHPIKHHARNGAGRDPHHGVADARELAAAFGADADDRGQE